ncbi:HD domain-containing protein [Ruminococcus sp. CLA-AA-H200]|uniref:HD domain-containing protein n=1 Tax=Ruminococcus turbiniformis TaxID=2881258 RepID=A0ABS8FU46_9FIRM|nr:HD domain-containing phosphohydrolase [Ruminococcus turbiniformis]MCC2253578.1 HD domain-containing protein [Ruminococcus turbiniformis]
MSELLLDANTKKHCIRTAKYAGVLALKLKRTPFEVCKIIFAALLHDIGKSKIPEEILNKPGTLTMEEMNIVRQHPQIGFEMLKGKVSDEIAEMVLCHHENVDGTGYYGKKASEIPIGAKIIRICDVYDSLSTERPYKAPWEQDRVFAYLVNHAGSLFDRECVLVFCRTQSGSLQRLPKESKRPVFGLQALRRSSSI